MIQSECDVIYCPFYEVRVTIWSEMIDKLGSFPVFVLTKISNPVNTIEKIAIATNLNDSTVNYTVEELIENDLLKRNANDSISLTNLGTTYLKIHKYLKAFSETKDSRFAVNAFTGQLENIQNESFYSITDPHGKNILPRKVSQLLVKNHNFSNVKDFMKDRINLSEFAISDDDYKYINFDLKPERIFYVPYRITKESITSDENSEHQIKLVIPIQKAKMNVYNEEVEKNKSIIKQLVDISAVDMDLLSDKGKRLLALWNKLCELNHNKHVDYYDCYSGIKLNYQPCLDSIKVSRQIPVVCLQAKSQVKCDRIEDMFGFAKELSAESLKMERIISFKSLVQME